MPLLLPRQTRSLPSNSKPLRGLSFSDHQHLGHDQHHDQQQRRHTAQHQHQPLRAQARPRRRLHRCRVRPLEQCLCSYPGKHESCHLTPSPFGGFLLLSSAHAPRRRRLAFRTSAVRISPLPNAFGLTFCSPLNRASIAVSLSLFISRAHAGSS